MQSGTKLGGKEMRAAVTNRGTPGAISDVTTQTPLPPPRFLRLYAHVFQTQSSTDLSTPQTKYAST